MPICPRCGDVRLLLRPPVRNYSGFVQSYYLGLSTVSSQNGEVLTQEQCVVPVVFFSYCVSNVLLGSERFSWIILLDNSWDGVCSALESCPGRGLCWGLLMVVVLWGWQGVLILSSLGTV